MEELIITVDTTILETDEEKLSGMFIIEQVEGQPMQVQLVSIWQI